MRVPQKGINCNLYLQALFSPLVLWYIEKVLAKHCRHCAYSA